MTSLKPGQHTRIVVRKKGQVYVADCRYMDPAGNIRRRRRHDKDAPTARQKLEDTFRPAAALNLSTVSDMMEKWLSTKTGVAQSTRERYKAEIRRLVIPFIGGTAVSDLSPPLLQAAIDEVAVQKSRNSAQIARSLLRQASRWAERMGVIERDFTAATILPGNASRHRPSAPSQDRITRAKQALIEDISGTRTGTRNPSALLAFEIMRVTGARIGEVCAVQWQNVDFVHRTITFADTLVSENGKLTSRGHLKNEDPMRISFVPASLLELLEPHRQESGPVVAARGGGRMSPCNLRRSWRRAFENANIPTEDRVRPHDLRRNVGTVVARNLGIQAAAEQLGDTVETARKHYIEPNYRGPEEVAQLFA